MDPLDIDNQTRVRNYYRDPIEIKHQSLQRCDQESEFRSICPICGHCGLFVGRAQTSPYSLQKEDVCIQCLHRFYYTDIKQDIVLRYEIDS